VSKEVSEINKAIKTATQKARNLNKIMGLSELVVKDEYIVCVSPEGNETVLKKIKFGKVKVEKRSYVVKTTD
jgi:predicted transcriptional regulator